jgi:DNA-binding XRE family transcriptional regulator
MVRSRGEDSAGGDASLLPASVPDIGHSLQRARELAGLTLGEAATRAGLRSATVEALESGGVGPQHDWIETLRALRTYATSLGLPGDDYVLVAIEQWPSGVPSQPVGSETAVVPVVSISSAPAGGHSPVGGRGSVWPGDATGVPDATITGVLEAVRPVALNDTGRVPIVDTGEVRAVNFGTPRFLKVLVGLAAVLVALGVAALVENQHLDGWAHDGRTSVTRWINDAKSAVGITSQPTAKTHHAAAHAHSAKAADTTRVTLKESPNDRAAAIGVATSPFTVQILAYKGPCWVEATVPGQPHPVFAGVLQANQQHLFTVTSSMTIETGSSAGRAFIYKGIKLIGFYFPSKVPFTMTFTAH